MKRFIILSALSLAVTTCFASGDYYSSGSGWLTFLSIVMFAWGILEIILFFKIWGMTNDVKAVKKDYFNEVAFNSDEQIASYIRKNLILDNKDNVKRILLQTFIDNIERSYTQLNNDLSVRNTADNLKKTILPYVETLNKQYEKVGEQLPDYIKNMKTYEDFVNIFTSDDLKVEI